MRIFFSVLAIGIIIVSMPLYAQDVKTQGKSSYYAPYNTETVEFLDGTIYKIGRYPVFKGKFYMSYLMLSFVDQEGNYEYITVHLGPSSFMEHQEIKLAEKDEIEVEGSLTPWRSGTKILVAAEITKDGKTIKLRDENGVPVWTKNQSK